VGQADGVACRTVEMFEAFGLAGELLSEAYWVNEVTFWRPDPEDESAITRTGGVLDTEEGLSEFSHVIVNQARILACLRAHVERSPACSGTLRCRAATPSGDGCTGSLASHARSP
jgi:phenol 2-monooxygenase